MKKSALLRQPTAYLPLLMSSCACAILIGYITVFGVTQTAGGDEGLAAQAAAIVAAVATVICLEA